MTNAPMETMTLEERMAAMEAGLQAALAEARAENEALKARIDNPVEAQNALQGAIDEFSKQYRASVPGQRMVGPCQQVNRQGKVCGRPWAAHLPGGSSNLGQDARRAQVNDHSYREKPAPPPVEKAKGGLYAREQSDVPEPVSVEYLTEKDAAKALEITVPALRKMIQAGTVETDRIAGMLLVRKGSVDRILLTVAMNRHEGVE